MTGLWKNPFGIKYLAFGNMILSVGIQPGVPVPVLGIYLGLLKYIRCKKVGFLFLFMSLVTDFAVFVYVPAKELTLNE